MNRWVQYLTSVICLTGGMVHAQGTGTQQAPGIPQQRPGSPVPLPPGTAQRAAPAPQQTQLTPAEQAKLDADLKASADAAAAWLQFVDNGQFSQSWNSGSKTFQLTIKQGEWDKAMEKLRRPLGNLVKRDLIEQRTAKNPKGLPEGEYMVLFYKSSFSNRPEANELITMVRESDGKWRVLTYHAR